MSQHVDFLKSIPKAKTQLPAELMMIGVAATLGLLLLISVVIWGYQSSVNKKLLAAQQANQQETVLFQKLAEAYPLLASDTPLVTKIIELEKALDEKEAHFAELTHTTIRKPFSNYLVAISQAMPEGIWLTGIHINQDSDNISLEGQASTPALITVFLKKLDQIPPFVGEAFDLFAVKKNPDGSGMHQFEIANKQLLNEKLLKEKKDDTPKEEKTDDKK